MSRLKWSLFRSGCYAALIGSVLLMASCAGSLSATADAIESAQANVEFLEGRVEQARAEGDSSTLETLEGLLESANTRLEIIRTEAEAQIAEGGPEDAQWAGTAGAIATGFGPWGVLIGGVLAAYADNRRRQAKADRDRIIVSLANSGVVEEATPEARAAIEKAQGPRLTATVKEVVAKKAVSA